MTIKQDAIDAVAKYLADHPTPTTFIGKKLDLKSDGRARAEAFHQKLFAKNISDNDFKIFLLKSYILSDETQSMLANSKELRSLLGDKLCRHYKISEQEVLKKTKEVEETPSIIRYMNPQSVNSRHEAIVRLILEKESANADHVMTYRDFLSPLRDSLNAAIDAYLKKFPKSSSAAQLAASYRAALQATPDDFLETKAIKDYVLTEEKQSDLGKDIDLRGFIGAELCSHLGISPQEIAAKRLALARAQATPGLREVSANPGALSIEHEAVSHFILSKSRFTYQTIRDAAPAAPQMRHT